MRFREVSTRPRSLRPQRPELYKQQSPVPEGWSFTDEVVGLIEELATSHATQDVTAAALADRVMSKIELNPLLEEKSLSIEAELVKNLPSLVRSLRGGEQRIASYLDSIWGPADRLYQAVTYVGYEIGEAVSILRPDSPVLQALLGLHARACTVVSEVRLCAMNGFASAAEARWRSLHELDVVSALLSRGDDALAGRYLASAAIERYNDAEEYQKAATSLQRQPYEPDELQRFQDERDRVLVRFGAELGKPNGWAAPLFPAHKPREQITFRALEDLANLGHFRPFYRLGSHFVHAGARSTELGIVDDGARRSRTTGATVYANISETCHGALISFLHITLALAIPTGDYEPLQHRLLDDLIAAQIMLRWVDQAGVRYVACADRAREEGLFKH